jgi:hypothetical protein
MKGKTQLPIPAGAEKVAEIDLDDAQKWVEKIFFVYF